MNAQRTQGPAIYNFCTQMHGAGLKSFQLRVRYKMTQSPINFEDADLVKMQLRDAIGRLVYEFSTDKNGEHQLSLPGDGIIRFPTINSWKLRPAVYKYDLIAVLSDGFVRPYMKGTWAITSNVTKI